MELHKKPVFCEKDGNGVDQSIFVLYHTTQARNVKNILANGLKLSEGGIQGPGLYFSLDVDKSLGGGVKRPGDQGVCFKVLVFTGRSMRATQPDTNGPWRQDFDSTFLPPENKVLKSGNAELCVKSRHQVRVLGVAYGHDCLDVLSQSCFRNLDGTGDTLDTLEEEELEKLIKSLSILKKNTRPQNSLTQILFRVFEIISALFVVLTVIKLAIEIFTLCQLFVMTMFKGLLLSLIKVSTALFVICCLLEIWQNRTGVT